MGSGISPPLSAQPNLSAPEEQKLVSNSVVTLVLKDLLHAYQSFRRCRLGSGFVHRCEESSCKVLSRVFAKIFAGSLERVFCFACQMVSHCTLASEANQSKHSERLVVVSSTPRSAYTPTLSNLSSSSALWDCSRGSSSWEGFHA